MPAIAFGTKTTRENNFVGITKCDQLGAAHLGPGYYELGTTLAKHKPSYVISQFPLVASFLLPWPTCQNG